MADPFAIREVLGVRKPAAAGRSRNLEVLAREGDSTVLLETSSLSGLELTPDEARQFARYLNRLARRIEERNA